MNLLTYIHSLLLPSFVGSPLGIVCHPWLGPGLYFYPLLLSSHSFASCVGLVLLLVLLNYSLDFIL